MSLVSESASRRPSVRFGGVEPAVVALLNVLDPLLITGSLLVCTLAYGERFSQAMVSLLLVTFVIANSLFTSKVSSTEQSADSSLVGLSARFSSLLIRWMGLVGMLVFVAFALKVGAEFSRKVVLTWFFVTPVLLVATHTLRLRVRSQAAKSDSGPPTVIVGLNDVGRELVERLSSRGIVGFFDFRGAERVGEVPADCHLIGHANDVADYVRKHGVRIVYITLPMCNVPRITTLVQALRDTTASIYFVPDAFAFGVIQGRVVDINGMPALSVCESPLHGTDAVAKYVLDVVIATALVVLLSPVLIAIAVAVRLSSPGPILFRQRRYGLNGQDIMVCKFRSMTVCEDGAQVTQATRTDQRVTRLGSFLRRTSLDELPQLFNVVNGSMSLVGPRPHAVAHNEMYRKLISGYMIRHKVRPGITGLAQVNGLRGETDTLDKMRLRVESDLEYLRHWSLWLDMTIIFRTVYVVFKRDNAY